MASTSGQEEFLAVIRKSQEAVIAAVTNLAETVRSASPKLASVYAPLTDNLPKPPSVSVPFADKLPGPEEAVANAYSFAEPSACQPAPVRRGPAELEARGRRGKHLRLRRAVACQPAQVRRGPAAGGGAADAWPRRERAGDRDLQARTDRSSRWDRRMRAAPRCPKPRQSRYPIRAVLSSPRA